MVIRCIDCRDAMEEGLEYEYAFFSQPDFDELGLEPGKDSTSYWAFLREVFELLDPTKNLVTIVTTDRKFNRGIIPKHGIITTLMEDLGWRLISQKIWCKGFKRNLYRLNYAFVLTFARGKWKQNRTSEYEVDVWMAENPKYKGYAYNMPAIVARMCIENFTEPNDHVFDPFMGSGTTGVACIETGRFFEGTEILEEVCDLAHDRLKAVAAIHVAQSETKSSGPMW